METVEATCPQCQHVNEFSAELIGRYTLCENCRCRFYVEVPKLGDAAVPPSLRTARIEPGARNETTLDELLWDTQQGSSHTIQLLKEQIGLSKLAVQSVIAIAVIAAINLILTIVLLLR